MSQAIWRGKASVKGSSESMRMLLLTASSFGLQICWGLEMAYCMPYLLELGLSKSKTSLVWLAGPLSGLIVAPLVGAVADRATFSMGRRRPFMIYGSFVVVACFFALGWAKEIVSVLLGDFPGSQSWVIFVAVFSIYTIDFSINVVMWSCRALLIDTLPTDKQSIGSAWASRMAAVGQITSYGFGAIDLKSRLGTSFGDTQFKQLTFISAATLLGSIAISSWAVTERVLVSRGFSKPEGPVDIFKRILMTARTAPKRIQGICWIQFWSWIGWFPFLFYSSQWIGEVYYRYEPADRTIVTDDRSGDVGRIGSKALVIYSVVTCISSIILPMLVRSEQDEAAGFRARQPATFVPLVDDAKKQKPSLVTLYLFSHLIFASTMLITPFVTSVWFATTLIALCGIPWAVGSWAPMAFIGIEINKISQQDPVNGSHHRRDSINLDILEGPTDSEEGPLAGIYLGLLNLYTTLPQFIGSFISMFVFHVLEPGKNHPGEVINTKAQGPNAISVCLFIGALCAFGAAYATLKFRQMV